MLKELISIILPHVFEIVITVISLTVARYVLPYIKADMIPWLKEKRLYGIVKSFVQAAEKLAESGEIEKQQKKDKVIELLENKGVVVDDAVEAFIESAVKELDIVTSAIHEEIMEEREAEQVE